MKTYLLRLTAAAILAALIRKLAPKSGAGRGARLGAGLLVLVCLASPLGELNLAAAAQKLAQNGFTQWRTADEVDQQANEMLEELISDAARSYILDKAQAMGVSLETEVTLRLQNRYPVPWSATIRSSANQTQRETLTEEIARDLGIPAERQEWLQM